MQNGSAESKSKSTILVVDDNPANLNLLTNLLGEKGYDVRPAISGALALKTLQLELPALILLDVKMPEMDGYEVCRRLKAEERSRDVPVIFITAMGETMDKVRGFNLGAVDYVTKPFQIEEILARVGVHINLRNMQNHLEEANRQLRESQEELERRVEVRTAELTAVNARLTAEIVARKHQEEEARKHQEKLFHAAKMVSLGTLVSGVAHEINNPATFIMSNAPILQKVWKSIQPRLDEYCGKQGDFPIGSLSYMEMRDTIPTLLSGILEGAKRIKRIVSELTDFARQKPPELTEWVDINVVVKSALTLLANIIKNKTDRFSVDYGEDIPSFRGSSQRIEQVVINLVVNACQALRGRDDGISVSTSFDSASGSILLKVSDEGIGIRGEDLPHICDPFFTTKRDLSGTGLGLSISSRIIDDHGGTITFHSSPGKGATVTVTLPQKIDRPHATTDSAEMT
jgi:signal transduction histidine kinase